MKHTSSILTVAFSLVALASSYGQPKVGNETFIGKVSLSKPSISSGVSGVPNGLKLANVSVSGTIQEQATVARIVDVAPPNAAEGYIGTTAKARRISNSTILKEVVGDDIKGWSLRIVLFYDKAPVVQAVKKNTAPINVSAADLDLYFGWPEKLDGVFASSGSNGAASATVSSTVSGTSIVLTSGKVKGFNPVEGSVLGIDFAGVGSFTETTKGYSGSSSVAGQNF
jgi:hypothetical protein